ncbi:hypothetical protein NQ315_004647 [Exocentrus adspersus]|uniref:Kinesin-like protein n=1 Tax=Exocentrus adspersus TaxID=1586481 RepID=A0AAV8VNV7_9CUCU|nr:hypothetical protein NQ315_004647 [Exocentrus adspersus]
MTMTPKQRYRYHSLKFTTKKVFDLLQNNNKPRLTVKGFRVQGFNQEKVFNCYEAKHFLKIGNKNRHTSETKQNSNSSRSHAVFTIYCNIRHRDHETSAKLNLVDLAGSESVKKTGNQGSTFQEGVNINKGLFCIGQVMTALSTNSNFIPYRQSIITTILQDSLSKKNLVSLIACVNENPEDCNETVQTLEFSQRVKKMKNKPEVNEIVTLYKKENPALFPPIKTTNTPFKRPASSFQTPCFSKRVKTMPLGTVDESAGNSSKSIASVEVSSISTNIDAAQQTLSPVIKRYMTAMESSLVDRIETIIKNTLKRPSRSSLLLKEKEQNEKENTPSLVSLQSVFISSMSWNKIQNEVSKLVRSEIAQLTSRAVRATSSPIDEHASISSARRVLKYESPVLNESTEKENNQTDPGTDQFKDSFKEGTVFKVPDLPIPKKKTKEGKRTPSISPIDFVPRRSIRLSLKRIDNITIQDTDVSSLDSSYIDEANESCRNYENIYDSKDYPHAKRRCSVRLAEKREKNEKTITFDGSVTDIDLDITRGEFNDNVTNTKRRKNVKQTKKANVQSNDAPTLNKLKNKVTVKATPYKKPLLNGKMSTSSPATAHTKYVLMLLNNGKVKELESLHSIGPKTAQQILLFREIRGPLCKISDLSSMPGWHGKKFKTFVEQNFIKDELL